MAFLQGSIPFTIEGTLKPLTGAKLVRIREQQLKTLREKDVPANELLTRRWQVVAVGQLEAYTYWLFQAAHPQEFDAWNPANPSRFEAWQQWLFSHTFRPAKPDLHRLHTRYSRWSRTRWVPDIPFRSFFETDTLRLPGATKATPDRVDRAGGDHERVRHVLPQGRVNAPAQATIQGEDMAAKSQMAGLVIE